MRVHTLRRLEFRAAFRARRRVGHHGRGADQRVLDHLDPLQLVQTLFEHTDALLEALGFRRVLCAYRIGHHCQAKQGHNR